MLPLEGRDLPFESAKLDFVEQFNADVVASGVPRSFSEYISRFPELAGWLEGEYAAMCDEVAGAQTSDSIASNELGDSALLERLRVRRADDARYRRGSELGHGGTSRVYSARDVELGRELAMKVLRGDRSRWLRRFLREARITSRLEHPGIVPVHELGVDSRGDLFFTMRLVRGRSLKQFLEDVRAHRDNAARRRALEIVLKVCDTIAFAHSRGVIHRDLKPSNVMLGEYGAVYVVDWGLARVLDRTDADREPTDGLSQVESPLTTLDGDVLGTPMYMPPEQAEGRHAEVGPHSDVYAIGAMLYHLISGRAPFFDGNSTPTSHEVLARVLAGPPRPLASIVDHVPPELIAIVERAMTREPNSRYPDGYEMAHDLRAFLEQRVVRAHAAGPFVRARKWVRRNVALSASLCGATLLASGGLFAWHDAYAKERDLVLLQDLRGPIELLDEFDTLWPVSLEKRPALLSWIARTNRLRERAPRFEKELENLRANGRQIEQANWIQATEDERHARRLRRADEALELTKNQLNATEHDLTGSSAATIARLRANIASLQREKLTIQARKPARVAWTFEDPRTQLVHDRLEQFLAEFDLVCGREKESSVALLVRIALARFDSMPQLDGAETTRVWSEASESIAASPKYGGFKLVEQVGLWPIGPDPRSGLWEFAHVASGQIPTRDARGALVLSAESALVLVLVPGGHATLGAQSIDPTKPCYDPRAVPDDGPPIEADFEPFLIGKFELSAAQWSRLSGDPLSELGFGNPALFTNTPLYPISGITAESARQVLEAYGLELPSSLCWEYAARAGTDTAWWCGSEVASVAGAGNIADRRWQLERGYSASDIAGPIGCDDGFDSFAPIGSFRANAFGLHDTIGNVWEWCRDVTERRNDDLLARNELYKRTFGLEIARGGSFADGAFDARSGARWYLRPDFASVQVGLRASRSLTR
jgi:formylglycine-generating enzyme required for sulfatase activity